MGLNYPSRSEQIQIAIDGPSGAGKTSLAAHLSTTFRLTHIDSGALYRAYCLVALRQNISLLDGEALTNLVASVRVAIGSIVTIDGEDVTRAIRTSEVSSATSVLATCPAFRYQMVGKLRELAAQGGIVMEGRDIGTVVLPAADVKIYLDATVEERVRRRRLQQQALILHTNIEAEIRERDLRDQTRTTDPLRVPAGATVVDSTDLTLDQVATLVSRKIYTYLRRTYRFRNSGQ
jgi:cytidylate kinase